MFADRRREVGVRQARIPTGLLLHAPCPRGGPRSKDHRVDVRQAREGNAFDEVRAQCRGATDVVPDHGRCIQSPCGDELSEVLAVHGNADVLLDVSLRLAEAQQVIDIHPVV